jgi:hypothetical protein
LLELGLDSNQQLALEDTVSFWIFKSSYLPGYGSRLASVGPCNRTRYFYTYLGEIGTSFPSGQQMRSSSELMQQLFLRYGSRALGQVRTRQYTTLRVGGHIQRTGSVVGAHREGLGTGAGEELNHLPRRVPGRQVQRKRPVVCLYKEGLGTQAREELDQRQCRVPGHQVQRYGADVGLHQQSVGSRTREDLDHF